MQHSGIFIWLGFKLLERQAVPAWQSLFSNASVGSSCLRCKSLRKYDLFNNGAVGFKQQLEYGTGKWRCLLRATVCHFSCKWVIRRIFSDGCGRNLELNQLPLCVFYFNRGITMHTVLGCVPGYCVQSVFLHFHNFRQTKPKVPPRTADGTFPKSCGFISHINLLNCPWKKKKKKARKLRHFPNVTGRAVCLWCSSGPITLLLCYISHQWLPWASNCASGWLTNLNMLRTKKTPRAL